MFDALLTDSSGLETYLDQGRDCSSIMFISTIAFRVNINSADFCHLIF